MSPNLETCAVVAALALAIIAVGNTYMVYCDFIDRLNSHVQQYIDKDKRP